ncbi:hypothetical protein PUN28_002510 [Cardiocondyla obscurior]|uniref:Uncharacterized protein n=1 Tax=Cardiocondyla obscurior TaxID=286306 RepID=A0AAW2GUM4_9HYME
MNTIYVSHHSRNGTAVRASSHPILFGPFVPNARKIDSIAYLTQDSKFSFLFLHELCSSLFFFLPAKSYHFDEGLSLYLLHRSSLFLFQKV